MNLRPHNFAFSQTTAWQRIAILLALVGMELSWFTPLMLGLHHRSWGIAPGWYLLALAALMVGLMAIASLLSGRQVASPRFELTVLVTLVAIALLILRVYVFWGEPALSLRWLADAFITNDPRRIDTLIVLVTLAYLWWRSVSFLQREVGFFSIGYDFRKGVLGLAVAVSFYTMLTGRPASIFVYCFFCFSLIAIALGRAEDKAQASSRGQPWGPGWLAIVTLVSLGMSLFIAVLHEVWNLASLARLGHTTQPAIEALGRVLAPAILYVLRLTEPILVALAALFRLTLGPLFNADQNAQVADLSQRFQSFLFDVPQVAGRTPNWMEPLFRVILPCAFGVALLFALVLWLQRRRGRYHSGSEREQRQGVAGDEAEGVAGFVQARWRRLQELAGLLARYGLGRRFYAAMSVRHIYANLQRLAAGRGYPRDEAQTANDYLPTLMKAFPEHTEAVAHITSAYNAFEYGHVPTEADELALLHAAWDAIRQAPRG